MTYDYVCENGHKLTVKKGMLEPHPEKCKECDGSLKRLWRYIPKVHFRGSGFYATDRNLDIPTDDHLK